MTEAQAIEAILQRWETGWLVLHPASPHADHVPYVFDNEVLEAPALWARVTVIGATRRQATMGPNGGRRFEDRGNIFVQLFGAIDAGDRPLALLAADVRTVLEARRIGTPADIVTYEGTSRPSPSDGRWAMRTVTVPYAVDEQR